MTTSLVDPRRRLRGQRARHAQRARGDPRAAPRRRRSSSPRRTRSTARSTTSRSASTSTRYEPDRRASSRAPASPRRARSTSTARTAARRARPTSTCSTTRGPSACRAVVFRMSCIYGPRQLGTEDQGWVAHFLIRALRGEPITHLRDGKPGARRPLRRRSGRRALMRGARAAWRGRGPRLQHRRRRGQKRPASSRLLDQLEELHGVRPQVVVPRLAPLVISSTT